MIKKKTAKAKKVVRNLGAKSLTPKQARNVKGGAKNADGSLDAGIHFKY
jgi:hypothetical protein